MPFEILEKILDATLPDEVKVEIYPWSIRTGKRDRLEWTEPWIANLLLVSRTFSQALGPCIWRRLRPGPAPGVVLALFRGIMGHGDGTMRHEDYNRVHYKVCVHLEWHLNADRTQRARQSWKAKLKSAYRMLRSMLKRTARAPFRRTT